MKRKKLKKRKRNVKKRRKQHREMLTINNDDDVDEDEGDTVAWCRPLLSLVASKTLWGMGWLKRKGIPLLSLKQKTVEVCLELMENNGLKGLILTCRRSVEPLSIWFTLSFHSSDYVFKSNHP